MTDEIIKRGWTFAQVPISMILDRDLSSEGKVLYAYLAWRQGTHPFCWPSVSRIAHDLNWTERTVQRHMRELENSRWISIEMRNNAPNRYTIFGERTEPLPFDEDPDPELEPSRAVTEPFDEPFDAITELPCNLSPGGIPWDDPNIEIILKRDDRFDTPRGVRIDTQNDNKMNDNNTSVEKSYDFSTGFADESSTNFDFPNVFDAPQTSSTGKISDPERVAPVGKRSQRTGRHSRSRKMARILDENTQELWDGDDGWDDEIDVDEDVVEEGRREGDPYDQQMFAGPPPRARRGSERRDREDALEKELASYFSSLSGCRQVGNYTTFLVRWRDPARELLWLCNWDGAMAKKIVEEAYRRLRKNGMTIESLASVVKTARAIWAEKKGGSVNRGEVRRNEDGSVTLPSGWWK